MLVDGVLDDKSFNSSANRALLRLEEDFPENIEKVFSSAASGVYSSYVSDLDNLKMNGSDLIWLVGYMLTDASLSVSLENPKISYGIIDPVYSDDVQIPKNLIGVVFRIEQGAFLAFYIAAKKSVSGKIGFIGRVKGDIVDALYLVASEYLKNNNTWEGGKIIQMGLDGVVGLSNANKFEYIKIIERKIVNEEIIVPDSEYAFDLFKSKL